MADQVDRDVLLCVWLAKDGEARCWEIEPAVKRRGWRYRTATRRNLETGVLATRDAALLKRSQFLRAIHEAKRAGWTPVRPNNGQPATEGAS